MTRRTSTAAPLSPYAALPVRMPVADRTRPAHRADIPPLRVDSRRRAGAGALVLTTALLLTGCSVPGMPGATGAPDSMVRTVTTEEQGQGTSVPVQDAVGSDTGMDAPTEESGTESAPDDGGTPPKSEADEPAEPEWVAVASDLDAGSVSHTLSAASRNLVIDYWTDADVSELTPESTPIVRVSARMDGADDGTAISVTRFNAQVQSLGTELANDTGSFAIAPPYAYTTAVSLPANPTAHSTEVLITFDLLTETAPGSGVFTRQTILDTVTLGYAQPPSSSDPAEGE
ncbi:hypothetical protein AC792_10785 [Arthrobacter sp. RIT-PI-e]|uniref:hypothetical protein n=1 Tax=Arthrobacter sp. RIT-PI-e TaxID=1681197 RepID=UPI00067612CD|nr:hypothetical protein [Arthrobacter sp. RIT-PI-e]KNC18693.1 hypothetical protein AC792_10785 [Arthrobacter sp. RIT-PI-e]